MVIKRVRLENFKAHRLFDREFGKFTVIFGRNGVGKSTILEAIYKALYPEKFGDDYIRRGEKSFKIQIDFYNGYKLYLHYPLSKKPQVYSPDGKILSVESLRKILNLPEEDKFIFLSFFEQGSLDDFGKELFDNTRRILDVDFPQKILEAIRGVEREKRGQIRRIEEELSKFGRWEKTFRELRVEIGNALCLERRIKREILKLERERKDLEILEGEIEELVKKLREKKEEVERIKGKINALEERREEYKGEIERLEKTLNSELPKDTKILKDILDFLKNRRVMEECKGGYEEYMKLEEEYRSILEESPRKIQEIEVKLEKLRKVYSSLLKLKGKNLGKIKEEEDLKKEREGILSDIRHHEKRLENLKIGGDRCPVCGEPLGKEKREKLIKESLEFLSWAKDRLRALEKGLEEIEDVKNLLISKVFPSLEDTTEGLEEFFKNWRERVLEDLDKVLEEMGEMGRSLKEEKERMEREYGRLVEYYEGKLKILREDWARYTNAKAQVEKLAKNIDGVEYYLKFGEEEIEANLKTLERLKFLKENLENLERDLESLKAGLSLEETSEIEGKLKYYEEEIDRVRKRKLEVVQRIAQLERERGEVLNKRMQGEGKYGEIRKLVVEMEKLKEGLDILESFKEAVERGKGRFISYAKEAFENAINEHFLHFFGFSDHFIRIEVDENFEPIFHTAEGVEVKRGRELSVNRVGLSGGQRTALGLVYRLALRRLFPNSPQILLLDEPTTHLDEERRRVVWRILWRISEEKDIQIIAVTHDDAVEEVISKENIIRLG
ncbi:MAG: SMC family ATPase [Candidatus Caldipriscus sp.]|nr:SMC family ATPase [Candidatus Caldipriscus sp.]